MRNFSLFEAVNFLKQGGIGIVPTDTIYGVVASALFPESVERVYRVRGRDMRKPCIILIANISDISRFGIQISIQDKERLGVVWPGKVSVIFPDISEKFLYLHRGTNTLAFRIPDVLELREWLRLTGPIIAPSANPEGEKPAETLEDAYDYFGEGVDFFVDGGMISGLPSTVVRFKDGNFSVVRRGAEESISRIEHLAIE